MIQSRVKHSEGVFLELTKEEPIRVLHVDDETDFLKAAKQILEMKGCFEVETASSVKEAKEKLKHSNFDVIVCDYIMPKKSGLQFLRELRESGNDIPFIIFTGKGREDVAVEALNLGADRYFSKIGSPETVYGELAHGIIEAVNRRRAENALKESEKRLMNVIDASSDGIAWVDTSGRIMLVNRKAPEILGVPKKELIGKNFMDVALLTSESKEKLMDAFRKRLRGINVPPYEIEFFTKDGKIIPTEVNASPIFEDGKIVGIQAIFRDLRARKRAEKALRDSEEKYRNLFENASDIIVTTDLKGNITDINRIVEEYGLSKDEIIGKNMLKFVNENYFSETTKNFSITTQGGQTRGEIEVDTPRGRKIFEYRSIPLRKENKIIGTQTILRDVTEQKKIEEELKRSEAEKTAILESMSELVVYQDTEHRVQWANRAAGESVNLSPEKLVGRFCYDIWHDRDRVCLGCPVEKALKTGQPQEGEITTPDGRIWFIRGYPIRNEKGKIVGVVEVTTNITKWKLTEQKLRESEELLKSFLNSSTDLIFLKDEEFRYLLVNKAYLDFLGMKQGEVLGKTDFEVLPEELARQCRESDKKVLQNGKQITLLEKYRGRIFESRKFPVKLGNGTVGIGGLIREVTEQKRIEENLRESKKHFETLFNLMVDPVAIVDKKGKILAVTDKVEEITGFKKEELVGKNFLRTKIASAKTKAIMMKNLIKRMMGIHIPPYEVELLTKDGRKLQYEINAEKIIYKGEPADMVVFRDISQRKTLETKLRVVGHLTRHDARNKLAVVTMNTFLLKKKLANNPDALKYLSEIELACKEVERIFNFARIYEKMGLEKLTYMDVEKTFAEAAMLFSDLKDVKVMNDCKGLTVLADSLLRQLFYNLIDNSLRHGKKVSKIRIYYYTLENDQLKLIYEDNGVGIPKAEKEKIFKEGYGKGTGYGLYLIKKMCEVYGWTIQEKGQPGKGAKFTITIPKKGKSKKDNYKIHK
jgi:PAS domain S-box-containing protein